MEFTIEVPGDGRPPDLILTSRGQPDDAVVREMRDAILAQVATGRGRRILIDHTRLGGSGWSASRARAIGRALAETDPRLPPGTRIAVLAPAPVDFGSLRMALTYAEIEHGDHAAGSVPERRVFTDRVAAIRWLREEPPLA